MSFVYFNFIDTSKTSGTNFNFYIPTTNEYDFDFIESDYFPSTYDFLFESLFIFFKILKSTSNDIIAIWADSNASTDSGNIYVSSNDVFMIIDMSTKTIKSFISQTNKGMDNTVLTSNDITDVNYPALKDGILLSQEI